MGIFSFLSRPKAASSYGVIDLSGSSVAFAAASSRFEHGTSCPVISASTRVKSIKTDFDLHRFSSTTERMVHSLLESKHASVVIAPDRYYCFLPSLFYINQSRIINFQPDNGPVKVTPCLVNDILIAEADKFRQTASGDIESRVIENRVMSIKLNGYEVANPFGQEANSIQIAQYVAVAPEHTLRQIRTAMMGGTHRDEILFHSRLFALFSTMRDVVSDKNFILIDISGEITDIAIVIQGIIMETASFPLGINQVIRQLATKAGGLKAAISQLAMIKDGHLEVANPANNALAASKAGWVKACSATLEQLAQKTLIPENFFVLGDDASTNLFIDWLRDPLIAKLSVNTAKEASINLIAPHLFKGFCEGSNLTDPMLMAECLFCDKLEQSKK
jgi:hypothetical protein